MRSRTHLILSLLVSTGAAACGSSTPSDTSVVDGGAPDLTMARVRKPRDQSIDSIITYQPVTPLVDPMIGTGGGGNVVPGALVPHGAVKLSPDSALGTGSVKAYDYGAASIEGFSHTHLEGPGGSNYGYSEILVVPTRGAIKTTPTGYASRFSHANEQAEPGYYAVDLDGPSAHAELTATRLCGVHRYTFTDGNPGNVLIDVAHSRGQFSEGAVEVVGNQEMRGHAVFQVDPEISIVVDSFQRKTLPDATVGVRTVFFEAHFSRAFDSFGTWDGNGINAGMTTASDGNIGAYATFQKLDTPIEVQVCLSWIDADQAHANWMAEASGHVFDDVRAAAKDTWNKLLNRIQIKGGTMAQQRVFYTALYHSLFQPVDYTEAGRYWSGADGKGTVLTAPDWEFYADDWCMWDTFRTTHPLQLLLEPERRSDIVNSMVTGYQRGGWYSKCTWQATGSSRVMIANPFVPIVADAYLKGFDEYDVETAFAGLVKESTSDQTESLLPGLCGYFNVGTPPDFVTLGYVAHECDTDQSASMTLEHSFDAWALARFADKLGHTTERDTFLKQAANYKSLFNPAHGFMQGRMRDGSWVEPFDPTRGGNGNDFTEATSWIYSWFVPHDVQGLVTLEGGAQSFVAKLDQYFDGGHHDPSNEPGFHVPYLYSYGGAPAQTQKRVRGVLDGNFSDAQDGLPGNDDSGAMSAWYVWSAVGLYPISPGDDTLLIGSPIFDQATIYLEPNFYGGKQFVVQTVGNAPDSPYVQSAMLNGAPLSHPFITHGDVIKGGTLVLQMGPMPSSWGSGPGDAPPSMNQ